MIKAGVNIVLVCVVLDTISNYAEFSHPPGNRQEVTAFVACFFFFPPESY